MKSMNDDAASPQEKIVAKSVTSVKPAENTSKASEPVAAPAPKKFEGKGLAGVVKKLSEEKLEDKAKRITEKLTKNPDKKDKVVEKEKRTSTKKAPKEEKPATEKKTKK